MDGRDRERELEVPPTLYCWRQTACGMEGERNKRENARRG